MSMEASPLWIGLLALTCATAWPRSENPSWDMGIVEVRGHVPDPGFYEVPRPIHLGAALSAAGATPVTMDRVIGQGMCVDVGASGFTVAPSDARLTLGLKLSIQQAPVHALELIPGIGPVRAQAIVTHRAQEGPFSSLDALTGVRGIGPVTLDRMSPYIAIN